MAAIDGNPSAILDKLGMTWKTPKHFKALNMLAHRSIHVVRMASNLFQDDAADDVWLTQLLKCAVDAVMFPSHSAESDGFESLGKLWDSYEDDRRRYAKTGIRLINDRSWDGRETVRAAWRLEIAKVGRATTIATANDSSAHFCAMQAATACWLDLNAILDDVMKDAARLEELQRAFLVKWASKIVSGQLSEVSASLAREEKLMLERIDDTSTVRQALMDAAKELGATSKTNAVSARKLVARACGSRDPAGYKKTLSAMVKEGMFISIKNAGPKGGYFIPPTDIH
jgi:hypothetical protein